MCSQYVALFILVLLNAKTIANADYVIEDTFEGESYKIYGPPTIPKQFSATLETVAHQSDKVSTPLILYTYITHHTHSFKQKQYTFIDTTITTTITTE